MKKIVITGGHSTPAIALVEEIRKNTNWQIFYLGSKYSSLAGKKIKSYEFETLKNFEKVKFIHLITGKIIRKISLNSLVNFLKIGLSFGHSLLILAKIKPQLIVSFGGYISTPVIIAGWLLGIPSITHEQTITVGLATKINSFFVKKIALSFPNTEGSLPKEKIIITGNLIRKEIEAPSQSKRLLAVEKTNKPIIYITGGKTGAVAINNLIKQIAFLLLKKYFLVHQTGPLQYQEIINFRERLPRLIVNSYLIFDFLSANEVGWLLKKANLVISRAGANTISELLFWQKPTILIPLPQTYKNEQEKNALFLKSVGLGVILNQNKISPSVLYQSIKKIIATSYRYKIKNRQQITNLLQGRKNLFQLVQEQLETQNNV